MKKTTIAIIAAIAAVIAGSTAQAGKLNPQGIAIPGVQLQVTPLTQCRFEASVLQGRLNESQEQVQALEERVSQLHDYIERVRTPGTCENQCVDAEDESDCLYHCRLGPLSRW